MCKHYSCSLAGWIINECGMVSQTVGCNLIEVGSSQE